MHSLDQGAHFFPHYEIIIYFDIQFAINCANFRDLQVKAKKRLHGLSCKQTLAVVIHCSQALIAIIHSLPSTNQSNLQQQVKPHVVPIPSHVLHNPNMEWQTTEAIIHWHLADMAFHSIDSSCKLHRLHSRQKERRRVANVRWMLEGLWNKSRRNLLRFANANTT